MCITRYYNMNYLYSALLHIRIRYSSPLISLIGCNALMLENGFLKWTLRSGKSRKTLKIVTTNITYNNCMDSKLEVLLTEPYSCSYVNLSALPILISICKFYISELHFPIEKEQLIAMHRHFPGLNTYQLNEK